jgi:hypothetical protein
VARIEDQESPSATATATTTFFPRSSKIENSTECGLLYFLFFLAGSSDVEAEKKKEANESTFNPEGGGKARD